MPHHDKNEGKNADSSSKNKFVIFLRNNLLVILTVGGVIMGLILGFALKNTKDWTDREKMYIGFLGDLFLRMLKSLILPLIVSSLISAISGLDLSLSSKIATRAMIYYLTTTFIAVILGIILVVAIKPGSGVTMDSDSSSSETARNVTTVDTLLDLVKTTLDSTNETDVYKMPIGTELVQNTNIMGLVVASMVIGIALVQLGEEAKTVAKFFQGLMAVMMKVTTWVIWLSPIGIMFLVAHEVIKMDNFSSVVASLGKYCGTVVLGLSIQGFLILPATYYVLTRKNPFRFIGNMGEAITTAFGTASSSASLPITIKCLEDNVGVDRRVARFALPIGATINLHGTALYEAVAAIFIAQVRNVEMSIGTLIAISITATAASIGAAGIPQAGMVTLVMVLDTVGLNASDAMLIIGIDWLLDRCRTAINVLGDAFGAAIVDSLSQKELKDNDERKITQNEIVMVLDGNENLYENRTRF